MSETLPIIAIVGEPNVGKSTLLNRIAGGMRAVTSNVPGTTRDRQYADTVWNGVSFTLVDTAGITFGTDQVLEPALNQQIDHAIDEADMLMLVVDGKADPHAIERKALLRFRKIKKPIVLVVNKADSARTADEKVEAFRALGIKNIFAVSAVAGRGLGDLLDYITGQLQALGLDSKSEDKTPGIAVSIIGKPNVGKSSLFNKIIKQERVVVSPVPGTTRTAIDTTITLHEDIYTFIDTAGLKRKSYRQEQPDVFGGFQTYKAIRRSDICLMVIDAAQEITKQDQHIAQEAFHQHKGVILVANKMDLFRGDEEKLRDYISLHFPFLWMSPLFLVSSTAGTGIDQMLDAIKPIFERRHKTIPQENLDSLLQKTLTHNPPKLLRDQKKPKVLGLTQIDTNPPMFELLVNHPAAISQQYRKFLEKNIMRNLDFYGTPITLRLKGKDKK